MKNKTLLALAIAFATTPAFAGPQVVPAIPATPAVPHVSPAIPATPAVPPVHAQINAHGTTAVQAKTVDVEAQAKAKADIPPGHVHANAATQGSLHGVKGSVGASIGMTANPRGEFDFNGDGSISQDETVASNRINAAVKQGVAGPQFRQIDANGDKILSAEEMSYYHVSLGKAPISLGLTANNMGQFDFNGDGTVSQAEIDASMRVNDAVKAGITSSTFLAIDTNHNGVLSAEELRAYAGVL